MLVNLGNIFTRDDTEKTLNSEYDFSHDDLSYDAVFTQPVISNLHLKKEDRDIRINLSVKAVADCTCARCLRSFKKDFEFSRDFILTPAIMNDPDIEIPVDSNKVLDARLYTMQELRLEIPTVLLCEEDCKGLCPVCGRPLRENCGCKIRKRVDPRLSVLDDLVFDE